MFRPTHTRRWITWLTLWVAVLGACLPTLSQAVVHAGDRASWVEVCTSTGMVLVRADDAGHPEDAAAQQAGCIWCLLAHGSAALLPPEVPAPRLAVAGPQPCPAARLHPSVDAWLWEPAQARAPPSVHDLR